jgi:hypothetical protein
MLAQSGISLSETATAAASIALAGFHQEGVNSSVPQTLSGYRRLARISPRRVFELGFRIVVKLRYAFPDYMEQTHRDDLARH